MFKKLIFVFPLIIITSVSKAGPGMTVSNQMTETQPLNVNDPETRQYIQTRLKVFETKIKSILAGSGKNSDKLKSLQKTLETEYTNIYNYSTTQTGDAKQHGGKILSIARQYMDRIESLVSDSDPQTQTAFDGVSGVIYNLECYLNSIKEFADLYNALGQYSAAGATTATPDLNRFLDKTIMCKNIKGIAKVVNRRLKTYTLKTVVGETPATLKWDERLDDGAFFLFEGVNDDYPIRV